MTIDREIELGRSIRDVIRLLSLSSRQLIHFLNRLLVTLNQKVTKSRDKGSLHAQVCRYNTGCLAALSAAMPWSFSRLCCCAVRLLGLSHKTPIFPNAATDRVITRSGDVGESMARSKSSRASILAAPSDSRGNEDFVHNLRSKWLAYRRISIPMI
jgi:hypothetical protein